MVYFSLVFDYRDNKLRHYTGENSIVFPLINNSNVKFESTSENFVQAQKSHPRRRRFFWCILISWFFELDRETAKSSCREIIVFVKGCRKHTPRGYGRSIYFPPYLFSATMI